MSVGTETEKFWDSLWELQTECTGLLWVERHPWARGDLGQSAERMRVREREREKDKEKEREEDEGPIWTGAVRNVQIQMLAERKKEVHTRTNTTQHCSRVKKGDKKGKEQQKEVVGFFLLKLPLFALLFNLKSCERSTKTTRSSQFEISVSHIYRAGMQTRGEKKVTKALQQYR